MVTLLTNPLGKIADEMFELIKDPNDEDANTSSIFVKMDDPGAPEYSDGSRVSLIH